MNKETNERNKNTSGDETTEIIVGYCTLLEILGMGIYYRFENQSYVIGEKIKYTKTTAAGFVGDYVINPFCYRIRLLIPIYLSG